MRLSRTDLLLAFIALAILVNAVFPRYEWRDPGGDDPTAFVRVDRWTGRADFGYFIHIEDDAVGAWRSQDDIWRAQNAGLLVRPSAETIRHQAIENARRVREAFGGRR